MVSGGMREREVTIEETRSWLGRAYFLGKEVDSLKQTLREYEEEAGLKAVNFKKVSVSSTKDPHLKFDMVADLSYQLTTQIEEKQKVIQEVRAVIEAVGNPMHRAALNQHYINRAPWGDVWIFLGYEPHTGNAMKLQLEAENAAKEIIENLGV